MLLHALAEVRGGTIEPLCEDAFLPAALRLQKQLLERQLPVTR